MKLIMKAYLDVMDQVKIYIRNDYTDVNSTKFYLLDGNNRKVLNISNQYQVDNQTIFVCNLNEQINFRKEYSIYTEYGSAMPLVYRNVVRSKEFDEMFYYNGDDLGSHYSKEGTTFKVWAPIASRAKVDILKNNLITTYELHYTDNGVWEGYVPLDLDGCSYVYLVRVNGVWSEAIDPYAYSSTPNHERSCIIDLDKVNIDLNMNKRDLLKSHVDAVIYELSVRDFTIDDYSNITNKGKFIGVVEEGLKTKGGEFSSIDYLKSLGISHVQFLPIYDFGSVDEENQFEMYNWGYDPVQYSVPEGSYASEIYNPYSRIIDLKTMISRLHAAGLRVNMDVVYNHMYDANASAFHNLVPYYFFRYDENNNPSNGSFCGNDIASDRLMVRKYIIDSIKRWVNFYGIDGFRFDLMGIIDLKTINKIRTELDEIDPSIMMYGEGWNMPTFLNDEDKAMMYNWYRLPRIGFFNDRFRDTVKGKTSTDEIYRRGYIGGDFKYTPDVIHGLLGSVYDYEKNGRLFGELYHSVNYIECHDNHTVYDKLVLSNSEEDEETIKRRARLGLAIVLLSQGIPFIHAGQEFFRTKNGVHNSYRSSDDINKFDWELKDKNIDSIEYISNLIKLRRKIKALHFDSAKDLGEVLRIRRLGDGVIQYDLKNLHEYGEYRDVKVLINGTHEHKILDIAHRYEVYVYNNKASVEPIGEMNAYAKIEPLSITLLMRK